jgi:hypothetical protein
MALPAFVKIVNGYPTIDVGALRSRVTIIALAAGDAPSYDASGVALSEQVVASAWAAIEAMRGTDVIRSGQTVTQLYLTIAMWYQPGLLPNMLVRTDTGSEYTIQSVENVREMNVVIVLNCIGFGENG